MLVDSHCHLNYKGLVERQSETLANARAAGVTAMLNISTRECEWDDVIGLASKEPDVWASGKPASITITTIAIANSSVLPFERISQQRGKPGCRLSYIRVMLRPILRRS